MSARRRIRETHQPCREKQGFSLLYEDGQKLAARVRRDLDAVRQAFEKAGLRQQS